MILVGRCIPEQVYIDSGFPFCRPLSNSLVEKISSSVSQEVQPVSTKIHIRSALPFWRWDPFEHVHHLNTHELFDEDTM
jgi:hypothetical protein